MERFAIIIKCRKTEENYQKILNLLQNKTKLSLYSSSNFKQRLKNNFEVEELTSGMYTSYEAIMCDKTWGASVESMKSLNSKLKIRII